MSSEDTLVLMQRVVQLEDIIAQYRHTAESMRARLTELEHLVGKVSVGPTGNQWWTIPEPPPTLVAQDQAKQ